MAWGNRSREEIQRATLFQRRLCLIAFLLCGAYLLLSMLFGTMGILSHRRMLVVYRDLEAERQTLTSENQQLRQDVQALRADPATLERLARERLGMSRPGETVYRFYKTPN